MRNTILIIIGLIIFNYGLSAQSSTGKLEGKITDNANKQPLMFATIEVYEKGAKIPITGIETDLDGDYYISNLDQKIYDVQIYYVGYITQRIVGVEIYAGQSIKLNVALNEGINSDSIEIIQYEPPIIIPDTSRQGRKITAEEIAKLPNKSISGISVPIVSISSISFFCTNEIYSIQEPLSQYDLMELTQFGEPIQAPIFKGNKQKLQKYFSKHSLGDTTIQGRVLVSFMVNCEGRIGNFRIDSLHDDFPFGKKWDILEIVRRMPQKWKPAKVNNKVVDCYQFLTLTIRNGKFIDVSYKK